MNWSKNVFLLSVLVPLAVVLIPIEFIRLLPGRHVQYPFWQYQNLQTRRRRRRDASTFHVTVPQHPDEHLVTYLPNITLTTKHWAGHLPASEDGTRFFFYWLVAPSSTTATPAQQQEQVDDDDNDNIPLIVWLNGGPGCSSMNGLFLENGPFLILPNGTITHSSPYSWHHLPAYMLYIDQPIGTGLSYKTHFNFYVSNDEQLQIDFYHFLQSFFQLHDDKFVTITTTTTSNPVVRVPFYFSGESYAGRYIPLFIDYIMQQNNKLQATITTTKVQIPIRGAAIGNGWIDPYHQYAGAKAAYGMGLVGLAEVYAERKLEQQCQSSLPNSSLICETMIPNIVNQSMGETSKYQRLKYDIRRIENKTGTRAYPPGKSIMEQYLQNDSVLEALHVSTSVQQMATHTFAECQRMPLHQLDHLDGYGVVHEIKSILKQGIKLLFYNGIFDLVCHHVGTELALDHLPWEHQEAWKRADRYVFQVNETVAGYVKQFRNLFFLKVLHAGHMVPLDVPDVAFTMMKNFVYGLEFRISIQRQDLEQSTVRSCWCCSGGLGWKTMLLPFVQSSEVTMLVFLIFILVVSYLCFVFFRLRQPRVKYDGIEVIDELRR